MQGLKRTRITSVCAEAPHIMEKARLDAVDAWYPLAQGVLQSQVATGTMLSLPAEFKRSRLVMRLVAAARLRRAGNEEARERSRAMLVGG